MSQPKASITTKYFIFLVIFLGMLTAFGPFVTDMYLPTLPSMQHVFNTTTSMVQLGLTTSMIGMALGQLLFGPLSDRYGRRPILFISLIVFSISTAISIFSPSIEFFVIMRFFQGIGAAGGLVLARSIATDSYSGRELAKTLAIIGAVQGVAPVTAPVIGGAVSAAVGWQGIFVILLAIGIALIAMCGKFRETLPPAQRNVTGLASAYAAIGRVTRIKRYTMFLLASGCANAVLFAYIASAPFAVQEHFGFSEMQFSLFFAVNATAIGLGAAFALRFKQMLNAATFGTAAATIFAVLQLCGYIMFDNFWVYSACIFMMLFNLGLVFTSTTAMAMDAGRQYTGAASALFGAIAFLAGGIVSPIVGIGDLMHSMSMTLVIGALGALATILLARRMS
jgi:DHA1 family bicyclomycin/chloramphenicol resistance-like MFS transporter